MTAVGYAITSKKTTPFEPITDRFGQRTFGTINPGFIRSGEKVQVGIEAIFPVVRVSVETLVSSRRSISTA
jgi:hypothetical protein